MSKDPISLDNASSHNDPAFYPFEVGSIYTTSKEFKKGSSQFQSGMRLRFLSSGYAPYDDAIVYEFENIENHQHVHWWLWSNESTNLWLEFFTKV